MAQVTLNPTLDQALDRGCRPSRHGDKPAGGKAPAWDDGWEDGPPAHVGEATLRIDLQLYRHAKCGRCQHRGLKVKAQHSGRQYRVLGTCPACSHEEAF
jgi:hypothetical protein